MTIYLTGVLTSIILELFGLTFSHDKDCNIKVLQCTLIAVPIFSLFSWLSVIIIILVEFRQRILKYED